MATGAYDNGKGSAYPFKTWVMECVSEMRGQIPRQNVTIELIDINSGAPTSVITSPVGARQWTLTNAWVTKYTAPDLDAKNSDVAIETVEIAYEELVIPNKKKVLFSFRAQEVPPPVSHKET